MDSFNREIKKISVALQFNSDFLMILCKAGGIDMSRNQAKWMCSSARNHYSAASRDVLNAVIDGVILWQREFNGDKDKFEHEVLLREVAKLMK